MQTEEIITCLKDMKSVNDLASLLDDIKAEECRYAKYGISAQMLKHFSSDNIAPKRFRIFHIRKKSGALREIKAPCDQLKVILKCLNVVLKSVYTPSESAMGFTSGKSVLTNAQAHTGQNYVFNIDLKDFFPSIPQARVWKRLQLPPFNFPREIANVVAGLCCSFDETVKVNVLPQGSPVSPLVTNAICDNLDRCMRGVAKRFGLHYTRYADDMTFSSMHNVYQEGSKFRSEIERIITDQGFRMNEAKTRLQKTGTRQEVTGLTVNAIANVSRKNYLSDLRWIINIWEKLGYAKAYALFYPKYKYKKGYIKKGEPVMENVISGKLEYLRMVRGANNPAYKKLADRFAALQQLVFVDQQSEKRNSFVYVCPYTMGQFESLFSTSVSLEVSAKKKIIGKCVINKRETLLKVSHSTQQVLCPDVQSKEPGEVITSTDLKDCYVTLCRHRDKNFWLITNFAPKRSRCLSIQNANFDVDALLDIWEKKGLLKAVACMKELIDNSGVIAGEYSAMIAEAASSEVVELLEDTVTTSQENTEASHQEVITTDKIRNKDIMLLIRFFTRKKTLNSFQVAKRDKLLSRDYTEFIKVSSSDIDVIKLLDIWETEGLDAAVKAWETAKRIHLKNYNNHTNMITNTNNKSKGFFPPKDDLGISKENLEALRKEVEEGGGEPVEWSDDLDFGMNDPSEENDTSGDFLEDLELEDLAEEFADLDDIPEESDEEIEDILANYQDLIDSQELIDNDFDFDSLPTKEELESTDDIKIIRKFDPKDE